MTTATTTRTRTAVTMRRRVRGFTVVMLRARYGWGMLELRLFAISINGVRDIFGADAELAARLRGVAAGSFAPPRPERSLLDRIGPLFSRPRTTEVDPRNPLPRDVDAVLSGGHIPEDRLAQCWRLLLVWLEDLAARDLTITIDGLDAVEFDLARAGLPSDYSLRQLAERELGTALRPLSGQVVGYSKHLHVVETWRQLRRVRQEERPEFARTMAAVDPLLELLGAIAARPDDILDLVVIQIPA